MVEAYPVPTIGIMAAKALATGHKFLNFMAMGIFMAALAGHGPVAEFQRAAGPLLETDRCVAIPAGNSQMTPGELELRFLMIFQRKGGGHETFFRVAGFAFNAARRLGKLPLAVIPMAIAAQPVFDSLQRFSRLMALGASHGPVFSLQWEVGLAVVKIAGFDQVPAAGAVTFCAIFSQLAPVEIPVTVGTFGETNPPQFLVVGVLFKLVIHNSFVAFGAFYQTMFPGEAEAGFGMVELADVLPILHIMAFQTIFTILAAVLIPVAAEAALGQPQVGSFQLFFSAFEFAFADNISGSMAFGAL